MASPCNQIGVKPGRLLQLLAVPNPKWPVGHAGDIKTRKRFEMLLILIGSSL